MTLNQLVLLITYVANAGPPSAFPHDDICARQRRRQLSERLTETDKLFSGDAGEKDELGFAVAVQGNLTVLGAPNEDENGFIDAGAVHIWRLGAQMDSSNEIARLISPDPASNDHFGESVAISGRLVVVGARLRDHASAGPDTGAAFVFRLTDEGMQEGGVVELNQNDPTSGDEFGTAVAISDALVLVGAPHVDIAGKQGSGAAYIFKTDDAGMSFRFITRLVARDVTNGDLFGTSVSIMNDFAIVGAPFNDDNGLLSSGSAYIYRTSDGGETWSFGIKLLANDPTEGAFFGQSVGVFGNLAAVGAYKQPVHGFESAGAVYLFRTDDNGRTWLGVQTLTASDAAGSDLFGFSLALTNNHVVIGAYADDERYVDSGAAYIFQQRNETFFEQQAKLVASDATNGDWFGFAVSAQGRWVVVGASLEDVVAHDSGAAYSFLVFNDSTPIFDDDPSGPGGSSSKNLADHVIIALVLTGLLLAFVLAPLCFLDSVQEGPRFFNRCVDLPIFIFGRYLSLIATIWSAAAYALEGTFLAAGIYWGCATVVFVCRCNFAIYVLFFAGYTVQNLDGGDTSRWSKCAWTLLAGFDDSILVEHLLWSKNGTYGGFIGRHNRETYFKLGLVLLTVVAIFAMLFTNILAAYRPFLRNGGSLVELVPLIIGDLLRFGTFVLELCKLGKAAPEPPNGADQQEEREQGQQEAREQDQQEAQDSDEQEGDKPDKSETKEADQQQDGVEMQTI